ncbi:MAG: prepilin-type N-terminal cleavage/methylation domain-containing protein, partial [Nitrospinae bacterium]|nr:prepilin-type N-terminal cleavage/methylation domain-containing protein [Nitrospinota bacterium]
MKSKINNASGFTLIELLIAALIITGGMVTMASFLGNLVNKNATNERKTMATVMA